MAIARLAAFLVALPVAWLLAARPSHAGSVQCFDNALVCFQAVPTSSNLVNFLIATKITSGWVGIGIGPGMKDADMMVLWHTQSGDWNVSRRFSSGYITPAPAPASFQNINIVNATRSPDSQGFYQVLLSRPVNQTSSGNPADRAITPDPMNMAYAYFQGVSVSPPNLPKHTSANRFQYSDALDSTIPIAFGSTIGSGQAGTPSTSSNRSTILLFHGLCMGISWSALSFISVWIARFMKSKLHKTWFPIHRIIFFLVLLLTLTGFILAVSANTGPIFNSVHGILGFIIVIATFLQVGLGVFIDKTFDPSRSGVPLRDKLHWIIGYILSIAAPINVILGHLMQGSSMVLLIINIVVIVAFLGLFAYGQFRIGQVHEHDSARKSDQLHNLDSDSAATALVDGPAAR